MIIFSENVKNAGKNVFNSEVPRFEGIALHSNLYSHNNLKNLAEFILLWISLNEKCWKNKYFPLKNVQHFVCLLFGNITMETT